MPMSSTGKNGRPGGPGGQSESGGPGGPGQRAFTMVEIMVVLFIIAVMATVGAVGYSGSSSLADLRQAGGNFELCAQYAHNYAITRHCSSRLVINRRENLFVLQCQEDAEKNPDKFVPIPGYAGKQMLVRDVRFGSLRVDSDQAEPSDSPGMIVIRFQPNGSADASVIEITNGQRVYSVVVCPSTGRARLLEGKVEELPNDKEDLDV